MLFVVGTGRCGTFSIATAFKQMGYDTHHERWAFVTVQASHWYTTRRMSPEETAMLLQQTEWGQVEVDANLSQLVPVLKDVYPEAKFLWVQRDKEKTALSMARNGWYRDGDDYAPDVYFAGFRRFDKAVSLYMNLSHAGHRTKAWQVTDLPVHDWRASTPHRRCLWYVTWLSLLLEHYLPEDRTRIIDIDTVTTDDLENIAKWVFPDQHPEPLDGVPNVRIEDPISETEVRPRPRQNTIIMREKT